MEPPKSSESLRTWIEIDSKAIRHNCAVFRRFIGPKVALWAVVKSNAYGHGIYVFSKIADKAGVDGFCVDSLIEGLKLRKEGIKKPVLVMGYTLPRLFAKASEADISVAISSFEGLNELAGSKKIPSFHLKVDTGMRRHGFYPHEIPTVIEFLKEHSAVSGKLRGVFTHFASADPASSDSAEKQFNRFTQTKQLFLRNGFSDLLYHASATAGTLLSKKYHCDLVRIGIGLYGLYPSAGIERHSRIKLNPVLSWRAVAGEVKKLKKGDSIGYDSTERARGDGEMAVLPVGYWHGVSRSMSSRGMVLVKGTRAKILGRVSMGITVVDVGGLSCKPGDVVTLVGKSGKEEIKAVEAANSAGTIHYEFLTRINPLIERIVR